MRLSNKKVGGLRFVRIGRLSFSYSISKPLPKRIRRETFRTDRGSDLILAAFAAAVCLPFFPL